VQKFPCIAVISTKVVGGIFIWFTWYRRRQRSCTFTTVVKSRQMDHLFF